MRAPSRSGSSLSYALGPGPVTPVVKALIIGNVAAYLITLLAPGLMVPLSLVPEEVVTQLHVWQLVTYLFLHGSLTHILFNMLTLWMFGTELERMWGSQYFAKFYFVAGIGAGLTQILVSFIPIGPLPLMYVARTIGASGAIYGLLLAYAVYFPRRQMLFWGLFPIEVRYFVLIMGGISLFSAMQGASGVAHMAHLGGILAGYLYLKGPRMGVRFNPVAEIKYHYVKWKISRMRKKFDIYQGGRRSDGPNRNVH